MATVRPHVTAGTAVSHPASVRSRREEIAVAVFGSWMLFGLYLDGWAHTTDKPETFFSPWHGVLYSGFAAALLWFGLESLRNSRRGGGATLVPADRLTSLGLVLFVAGALGDGLWHEVFGIEVGLEALLSPTHLLLLIGGFLMITGPVRAARDDPAEDAGGLRQFLPTVVTLTLATAVVSFFTMYLSAFMGVGTYWVRGGSEVRELLEIAGIGAILVTNVILLAPVLFVLQRWRPPAGTFTILFSTVAIAMAGLAAFERPWLALAGVVGGVTADALVRSGRSPRQIAAVVPLTMWTSYFVIVALGPGIGWAPELVAGSVTLTVVCGLLLTTLALPQPAPGSGVESHGPERRFVPGGEDDGAPGGVDLRG
jgi:hypothetical protein